ncbi:iron complex transport system substrate-binding protein [Chryseobacterium indologenes]|uniref:ABC transporter substrate-binding protein n=1 Tax=Chryseobacterium indologenes TaxID=253 RepID=UPI0003E0812B|nr:ABC transporter substrate-binding protein [Chryseobacterium indologenes]GAE63381.1 putative iron ABC transporter substrate-binding protein [Chryseobacterium indologenes NBRC 14944]SFJ11138.1 iron complex transport system substrate-binding protein [Chryseobacterium indologenes]SUX49264.1 corrinoid ABC transporter substrate-binding protein [Chryseobacterium indologenes]
MNIKNSLITSLFAVILLLQSCQKTKDSVYTASSDQQVTATDSRGKAITLPHEAIRIVVLYNALVDDVYMLQAGKKIVGIPQQIYEMEDTYSFLSKLDDRIKNKTIATPTFGGQSSNAESIVGLKPDLVLTFNTDQDNINQLENLGIPVFTFSSLNDAKILDELKNVGKLLGKEKRAEEITGYVSEEVKKMRASQESSPKKIYYAWSKGRIMSTSGKGSLIDMAITLSGAQNVCPVPIEAPNISAETMYKWNPDLIILWNSRLSDVYDLKELAALPAVKNKQVFAMSPSFPYDPHTVKFMLFAKQLRHWCMPEYTQEQLDQDVKKAFEVIYGKKGLI